MATPFKRKGSRLVCRMTLEEREAVASLIRQTRELVRPDDDGPEDPLERALAELDRAPTTSEELAERDPALQRLLPPASRDDEKIAQDFRVLTEDSLRRRKSATMATAASALEDVEGDKVELDHGQAQALMMALADVRLVLGERLGLHTDEDSERLHAMVAEAESFEDDPQLMAAGLYDFVTWLQESTTQALLR